MYDPAEIHSLMPKLPFLTDRRGDEELHDRLLQITVDRTVINSLDEEITQLRKGMSKFEGRGSEKSLRTYQFTKRACLPLRKQLKRSKTE